MDAPPPVVVGNLTYEDAPSVAPGRVAHVLERLCIELASGEEGLEARLLLF